MNNSFDNVQSEEAYTCPLCEGFDDQCPNCGDFVEPEDDGQPSEYDEWQDVYGGDDWDHGQADTYWDHML